jgi:tetratricopeptide (TPR) repeat protein
MEAAKDWFSEGVTQFQKENYTSAIAAFDKAISLNQNPVDAWCNRGLAHAQMGQYPHALKSIEKALSLDPAHENARAAREMILARIAKQEQLARTPETTFLPPSGSPPQSPGPQKTEPQKAGQTIKTGLIRSPLYAALFSGIFPGWGQWYDGRRWEGLLFLFASFILGLSNLLVTLFMGRNILVSGAFMVIGLGLWIFGMSHAYRTAERINKREIGFTEKSRLFWLPVIIISITIVLLIVFVAFAFMLFGTSGGLQHASLQYASKNLQGATGNLQNSSSTLPNLKVIAVTAKKPDATHIMVTFQGGKDAAQVSQIVITATDSGGKVLTKTIGNPNDSTPVPIGSSVTLTGSFAGKNPVVAKAKFRDGTVQTILDTTV